MKSVRLFAMLLCLCLLISAGTLAASAYAVSDGAEKSYAAATEGMVLLRNEDKALPLTATDKIALFGEGQVFTDGKTGGFYLMGRGSGYFVLSETPPSPYALLTSYAAAGKLGGVYDALTASYQAAAKADADGEDYAYVPTDAEYTAAAAYADKAVVFISRTSSEGSDRPKSAFSLSAAEKTMLQKVCAAFNGKPVVVVLNLGNVVDCGFALGRVDGIYVDALLTATYPGIRGVQALCDILVGDVNPSGKLVDTYAKALTDYPSHDSFYASSAYTTYNEDIYVGYRYFETFGVEVDYPFGYGLSYTTFAFSDVAMTESETDITVSVKVTNTGDTAGKEVVQVYFGAPQKGTGEAVLSKAAKELCGFAKTSLLAAGESETVTVSFPIDTMASYDDLGATGHKSAYVMEAGDYTVYVGNSVKNTVVAGTHTEEALRVTEQLSELCEPTVAFERMTFDGTETVGTVYEDRTDILHEETEASRVYRREPIEFAKVLDGTVTMDTFLAQMSDAELASMAIMSTATATNTKGWGGSIAVAEKYMMPVIESCDGPAGIRHSTTGTGLPSATALANTWNPALTLALGDVVGRECIETDIDVWLAPGVNIHRFPLCGRNFEYYSEDPYIAGVMAGTLIRGVEERGIACSIKHFVGNEKEGNRSRVDTRMSERALREIYLVPFKMGVEAGVRSIMTSYNFLNGRETAEHPELLRGIVRGEWGFTGMITTDWTNDSDVANELIGGNNVHSSSKYDHLQEKYAGLLTAVKNGKVSRSLLIENANYVMDLLVTAHSAKRLAEPPVHTVTENGASTFEAEDFTQKHGYARPERNANGVVMAYTNATAEHVPYLCYTLDVEKAGSYILSALVANNTTGNPANALHVFVDGAEQYTNFNAVSTGSWSKTASYEIGRVDLPAGKVTLKIKCADARGCGNFDTFTLTPVGEAYTAIGSADELLALMGDSTKWAGNYYLTADIDLTGKSGQGPIGTNATNFTGKFDGMGHAIRGLALVTTTEQDFGLFGKVKNGVIRDVKVYGSVTSNFAGTGEKAVVGGIVGTLDPNAFVVGCENHATVTVNISGNNVKGIGGIAGYLYAGGTKAGTVVKQCTNYGDVSANCGGKIANLGGIAGVVRSAGAGTCEVERCVNHGKVYGEGTQIGGIAGILYQAAAGGNIDIVDCVNRGEVVSTAPYQLIAGTSASYMGARCGGVVGYYFSSSVTEGKTPVVKNCIHYGTVEGATGYELGGIAGYLSTGNMENCVNYGTVVGGDDREVAGILGKTYTSLTTLTHTVTNCYTVKHVVIPTICHEKPTYFVFTKCGTVTEADIAAGKTTLVCGEEGFLMTEDGLMPAAFLDTLPLGDVDADGDVALRDALLQLRMLLNRDMNMNPWFADIDENGKHSLLDTLLILKLAMQ